MRIAVFHELPKGGAEYAVNQISRCLKKRKVTVDLYTTLPILDITRKNYHDCFVYNFQPKDYRGRNWKRKLYKDTFELLKLYYLHKRIASDIDKLKYDLVFVHASQFIETPFITRFLKTKSVFYCHDPHDRLVYDSINTIPDFLPLYKKKYELLTRSIRKYFDRQNFLKANKILSNSKYTKKGVKKTYGRDSEVVYLGVDTKLFRPLGLTKKYDVLFIGSSQVLDGFDVYVEILKKLPKNVNSRSVLIELEWISDAKKLNQIYK